MKILVLHGVNLDLLGRREPGIYGHQALADLDNALGEKAQARGADLEIYQSNHEGALVERLHQAMVDGTDAVVFNPGAYTHTSVALRDAVVGIGLPVIEVHLSNTAAREGFRKRSLLSPVVVGTIAGLGIDSYLLGLDAALAILRRRS